MAGFGGFPGTIASIAEYNLLGQILGAALTPLSAEITYQLNRATMLTPLSPAELALAVVRTELTEDAAAAEAAMAGVNRERFHTLARITGNAPAAEALAVALRRGLIDQATYDRGVAQGNLRTEWGPLVRELAVVQPSPVAMLQAYLEGQIPEAEARSRYAALGGDPDYFDILFRTQGQAPTPMEAAEAARRGIIPWDGEGPEAVSFHQSFLEGPWRNKWEPVIRALSEYLPPPRTVTAMYREGSLSHDRAAELLSKQGLAPDLVEAYLSSGAAQKTAAAKDLAQSTVTTLYRDRLISRGDAAAMIEALGYDATEADFILSIEDTRVSAQFLALAVSRVHSLYVGHRIDRATALATLGRLELDQAGASDLVSIWDWERAANVKTLTPADVAAGLKKGLLDASAAVALLVDQGYTPHDAWLYLSIHSGATLPNEPAASSVTPPPAA